MPEKKIGQTQNFIRRTFILIALLFSSIGSGGESIEEANTLTLSNDDYGVQGRISDSLAP